MRPMYEVSTIAVEFMTRMLDKVSEMENSVSRIQAGKLHFQNEMRKIGYKVLDTKGNFAHIAFGEDLPLINAALAGHVLYRGSFAHSSLLGYSRFSVAPLDAMSRVINLINQAIAQRGN